MAGRAPSNTFSLLLTGRTGRERAWGTAPEVPALHVVHAAKQRPAEGRPAHAGLDLPPEGVPVSTLGPGTGGREVRAVHICRAPTVDRTYKVEDDRGSRYCYACRKQLPHHWEPPTRLRCSGCGDDRASFPGTTAGPRPIPRVVLERFQAALDKEVDG